MVDAEEHDAVNVTGRHAVLMEAATDAIVVIDAKSTVIDANRAAMDLFGYDRADLLGRNLSELQAPVLRGRHAAAMERYLRTGERRVSWQMVAVTARHRTGREFSVEVSFGEFTENGERRFLGVIRDTGERRRLESQLRQAQKMEALGLLAGGIAHDFNNLLTVIGGYADTAAAAVATEHPAQEDLTQIRGTVDRASSLIRQLLAFSRREVVEPVVFDPAVALGSLESVLRHVVGDRVNLVVDAPLARSHIRMDPTHFDQVVINIAANARDAMPEGGTLAVRVRALDGGEPNDAFVAAVAPPGTGCEGWLALTMTDTGIGMNPETLERILEPFYTTKDALQGTGLGLATVHGAVHQAGGSITVESECGVGTTFQIQLPLVASLSPTPEITACHVATWYDVAR